MVFLAKRMLGEELVANGEDRHVDTTMGQNVVSSTWCLGVL